MAFFIVAQFILFLPIILGSGILDCHPSKCSEDGLLIQFPFRQQNFHPQHCGYPGFDLYCDENNVTILQLPFSLNVSLYYIDYVDQTIFIDVIRRCPDPKLLNMNMSTASPFSFVNDVYNDYVLFNCSTPLDSQHFRGYETIPCLGGDGYEVGALPSTRDVQFFPITKCNKVVETPFLRDVLDFYYTTKLTWSEPSCGRCESKKSLCGYVNATLGNQTYCIPKPLKTKGIPIIAGATVGSILFVAALVALFCIYKSIKTDKKIEKFLKDYEALKPTRFSYADLKKITNNFTQKLGEGGYGIVYKGKLSKEIYVAVKLLNNTKGNGEEFVNEVKTIGGIHHVNIVRLVGFCADGFRRALIYDYLPNDSLEKFIYRNGPRKNSLTWEKMQEVAIGTAKGIEYLHQGCDQQILHLDIKPHNILLDENHNPKICDFGLAKFCSKEQSAVSMTDARGTIGYIAPEMISRTFGRVSYKSDVYSFGMMLLEMVGGRKNIDTSADTGQVFFPKWIYDHLSEGEDVLVTIDGSGGDENGIIKKLVVVGLKCIQWYPADRPSMKMVVQMLEGDVENLSLPANPFPSTNVVRSVGRITGTELGIVPE